MNDNVKENILERLRKQSPLTNSDEFSNNVKELKDLENLSAIKVIWSEKGKPIAIFKGRNFASYSK